MKKNNIIKDLIFAPFTDEQVEGLNFYQKMNIYHPFTCGGNRTDKDHLDGEGLLVATKDGWKCPYCDYTQNWAHASMADKPALENRLDSWKDSFDTQRRRKNKLIQINKLNEKS